MMGSLEPAAGPVLGATTGLRGRGADNSGPRSFFDSLSRSAKGGLGGRQDDFLSIIARSDEAAGAGPEAARAAAEQLVSLTLVQPVLAQLRESGWGAEPFKPGEGEQRLGALADAQTALNIVRAAGFPLVDRLAEQLLRRAGAANAPDRSTQPEGKDANDDRAGFISPRTR